MNSEKALIKNLQKLGQIKPDKAWVFSLREEILREPRKVVEVKAKGGIFLFPFLKEHLAGALTGAVSMAVVAISLIVFLPGLSQPQINQEQLMSSLRGLNQNLQSVNTNLKQVKTLKNILDIRGAVSSAISESEKVLSKARSTALKSGEKESQAKVLSALTDVENTLSAIKETSQNIEKESALREIAELKKAVLTDQQLAILKQAQDYFDQGNYEQALEKIVEASEQR